MFDKQKFMDAKFSPRNKNIDVPGLAPFFDPGEKPVWVIKGLTADEVSKCNDASSKNKNIASIVEALSSKADQSEAIKELLGVNPSVHSEVAKRMEYLVIGSVTPAIDLDVAVKIANVAPIEFFIATEIMTLTGMGQQLGEVKSSGEVKE